MTTRTIFLACAFAAAVAACSKDAPSSSSTRTTGADNTAINDRDRHDTVTPTNQGNSKDDIAITAAIRQSLMSSSLSFDAKNAKVVTNGSKVTLRGPVDSDAEKASVESMAKGTQGVTAVDDQLEVKK